MESDLDPSNRIWDNLEEAAPGISAAELMHIFMALKEHPNAMGEIVHARRIARGLGCLLSPVALAGAALGWLFWKWYAVPITLGAAFLLGALWSACTAWRLRRRTGLTLAQQDIVCRAIESANQPTQMIPLLRATIGTPDGKSYRVHIEVLHDDVKPVEYVWLILTFAAKMLYVIDPEDPRLEPAKECLIMGIRTLGDSGLSPTTDVASFCMQEISLSGGGGRSADREIDATLMYVHPMLRLVETSLPETFFPLQFFHSWLAVVQQSLGELDEMHLTRLAGALRRMADLYLEEGVDPLERDSVINVPSTAFWEAS